MLSGDHGRDKMGTVGEAANSNDNPGNLAIQLTC